MGCWDKTPVRDVKPKLKPGRKADGVAVTIERNEDNPEFGCYFYIYQGACYMEYSLSVPDSPYLLLAIPSKPVGQGRIKCHELYNSDDEDKFLDSIIEFLKDVSPLLSEIKMAPDANKNSLGFTIMAHQQGNEITGNRAIKLLPGKSSLLVEGTDCFGVTLASQELQSKSPQTLEDFIEQQKSKGGRILRLDSTGKEVPL